MYGDDGDDNNDDVTPATTEITDTSGDDIVNESEVTSITIKGTIGEGGSTLVTIKIVDENTDELFLDIENISIDEYGNYTLENVDLSTLQDGDLTLSVTSIDEDGNSTTKTDTINKDTFYGDDGDDNDSVITPATIALRDANENMVIDNTELSNSTISGTIGEGAETLDSLVIQDSQNNSVVFDVEEIAIAEDGTYTLENVDLSVLEDGELTLTAKSTDKDGNKAISITTIDKDIIYGDDSDDEGTDITPADITITDSDDNNLVIQSEISNSTISGTIGEGAETLDSLVIQDSQNNSIAFDVEEIVIAEDGTYSIENVDLSMLEDGQLTITAMSTDVDGNQTITTDSINKDITYGNDSDDEGTDITPADVILKDDSGDEVINEFELENNTIKGTLGEGGETLDSLVIQDSGNNSIAFDVEEIHNK